jgi:tetratricopeptide (TPR) repeat protein
VTDRSSFGYIYFDRGSICYASIVNRRDRLGDLLVKNGLVEPEVLAAAVEAQGSRTAQRLGEILIERDAITRDQLERYLRLQIEEAVYFLFTWTQGSFFFEADQRPEEGAMLVSINPENLLLEGARRVDEWSLIEKKIPSLDVVFGLDRRAAGLGDAELTDDQRKILPLLDGHHSVREVVDESGMVEFDVGKALFGLIQAGFVHPQGRKPTRTEAAVPPGRIHEHRNLGIAFYRTGMHEEAAREFRRVLELQPESLEARFFLALLSLRAGASREAVRGFMELIERGGRWGTAFHDLGLAFEGRGRLDDALLAVEEADRLLPNHPPVLLSRAILLLKAGRALEAVDLFRRYRERTADEPRPPAAYHAFASIAEASVGRLQVAREIAEAGVHLHPHVAPLLLHAGAIRERMGAWDEAEILYRRATEEDPELPQARKALGDALYRRGAYDEAEEHFARAVELAPRLGDDVFLKLGNIRYKQMDREGALEHWRRSLELNPENGIARTNVELVERVLSQATT